MDSRGKAKSTDCHPLIGNGFSIGLHQEFNYSALFEKANLSDTEKGLFGESHDFEKAISNLNKAKEIIKTLESDSNPLIPLIQGSIDSIKEKLIKAVHNVHPESLTSLLDESNIQEYGDILEKFRSIYVLNYDLLLYWLLMVRRNNKNPNEERWRDGFRGQPPHWPGHPGVNFFNLHGSLYFIKSSLAEFELEKLVWSRDDSILQKVDSKINSDTPPVYVCEGTSQEKIDHIFHSDNLGFTFEKLNKIEGNLVLYGVSLDDNDTHIWKAISKNKKIKNLFVSFHVYQSPIEQRAKAIFNELYDNAKVSFFPATLEDLNRTVFSSTQ